MPTVVTDIFESRLILSGVDTYISGMHRAGGAVGTLENRLDRLNTASLALGAGAAAIGTGLGKAVQSAGRMQQLEIGFTSLLGSADAAKAKLAELQEFAQTSPFEFEGIVSGTQKLIGAGLAADHTIPVLQALGNVMSANGSSAEDFNEALRQVSQIIGSGKLQGDELRILSERGLPRAELIKAIGKQTGITANEFLAGLIKMGSGAKYAQAMANQSKTLFVQLSNLHDAAFKLGVAVGQPLVGPLADLTKWVTGLATKFTELSPGVQSAVSWLGVGLVGVLGAASLATKALAIHTAWLLREQLRGTPVAKGYAAAQGQVAVATGLGSGATTAAMGAGLMARMRGFGGRALKSGVPAVVADLGLEWFKQKQGPESTAGKWASVGQGAINGAGIMGILTRNPWGVLAGAAVGAGIAGWNAFGGSQGGQQGKPGGKKSIPQLLEELLRGQRDQTNALKDLHSDLNAGVGSSDVIDVMGEARVLKLLAGRMAG